MYVLSHENGRRGVVWCLRQECVMLATGVCGALVWGEVEFRPEFLGDVWG